VIPEVAVEAAAKAVFLTGYPEGCGVSWDPTSNAAWLVMRDIRTALDAAAQPLMAIAWQEGADSALHALNSQIKREPYKLTNPYKEEAK
jgi:hypothetical protein